MSAVNEAMEYVQYWLFEAARRADQLGRLFVLGVDERGRPAAFVVQHVRQLLAEAMRQAADGCEVIGVQHDDTRWCGPVALIHNASTRVWTVNDAQTCGVIAALMVRMRHLVTVLRDRARGREVAVRLN